MSCKKCSDDVETHQLAVGAEQKMISLSRMILHRARRVVGEGSIPMITVDSLGLDDVDMIKIDVEGYEMEVLKGADEDIRKCTVSNDRVKQQH